MITISALQRGAEESEDGSSARCAHIRCRGLVDREETTFGELPGGSHGGGECHGSLRESGEDAEEEGVGDGQEGAVAPSIVVEEGGAVAGSGVEVGEALAVFAA